MRHLLIVFSLLLAPALAQGANATGGSGGGGGGGGIRSFTEATALTAFGADCKSGTENRTTPFYVGITNASGSTDCTWASGTATTGVVCYCDPTGGGHAPVIGGAAFMGPAGANGTGGDMYLGNVQTNTAAKTFNRGTLLPDGGPLTLVASAGNMTLQSPLTNNWMINGTTTINQFGACASGYRVFIQFLDAMILHDDGGQNLSLPGGQDITTAQLDTAEAYCDITNQWIVTKYNRFAVPADRVSDTVYGSSWNGTTNAEAKTAPSKNAVYDRMEMKANAADIAAYSSGAASPIDGTTPCTTAGDLYREYTSDPDVLWTCQTRGTPSGSVWTRMASFGYAGLIWPERGWDNRSWICRDDNLDSLNSSVGTICQMVTYANFSGTVTRAQTTTPATVSGHNGIMQLSTVNSANAVAAINTVVNSTLLGTGTYLFEAYIKLSVAPSTAEEYYLIIGFTDATALPAAAYGAYFLARYATDATNWNVFTRDTNSTSTTAVTNPAVSYASTVGSWHKFTVVANAAGTHVFFYIDDVLVKDMTATIPTGAGKEVRASINLTKTNGTATAVLVDVDWITRGFQMSADR